jgi:hypothetical protein
VSGRQITRRGPDPDSTLNASRRFSGYKKESPKRIGTPAVKQDRNFQKILRAWERADKVLTNKFLGEPYEMPDLIYEVTLGFLDNIAISAKAIERFSIYLSDIDVKNEDLKVGMFISALISQSKGKRFRLNTRGWGFDKLTLLGYRNTKRLTIHGDAGERFGNEMSEGIIIVNGDASLDLGEEMGGGTIIINGNVMLRLECETTIGRQMTGGEIHINGNVYQDAELIRSIEENVGEVKGGRIYHKGKLIVDK